MKSKLTLLTIIPFLLVGCGNKPSSEESKKESSISQEETSSISESSEEESSTEITTEVSQSEEESTSESSEEDITKSLDVTFLNNEDFPTGGLENDKIATAFVEAFNDGTDLLLNATSAGQNLVQIASNDSKVCYINSTLQIGSRSGNGVLSLSFNYKVIKVEAVVQGYWTAYQYTGIPVTYSVDEYANICIGNDDNYVDLSSDGEDEPEKMTVSFEFNGVYSLDLYNLMNAEELPSKQGQRSYIHSLSITYIE